MSGRRRTAAWAGIALVGLVLAAGLTSVAAQLSNQRVGLSSEPLTAGDALAPTPTPTRTATLRPARTATPRPTRTAAPSVTRTAVPSVAGSGGHGSDDGSGDDSGGRGRGRGRGGDD